jgi:hypothetical protein
VLYPQIYQVVYLSVSVQLSVFVFGLFLCAHAFAFVRAIMCVFTVGM